jgi:hypothetical protein
MVKLRFPLASLAAVLLANPAFAQAASIKDIEVSRDGDKVSILVQLSLQPAAAGATASTAGLTVDIDGVDLMQLTLEPPPGSLVSHVAAAGRRITLSGAGFSTASTVIYRNAVLIEATLAEPALRGASLMPTKVAAPAAVVAPAPAAPVTTALTPVSTAQRTADDHLKSHPAQASARIPIPSAMDHTVTSTAGLAGIDQARCNAAVADLAKDPWQVAALGDHALCLLDQGKSKEASNRIEQLAAFAPEDWRIALGRAVLAAEKGDASAAEVGYRTAAMLAPDDHVRAAIATRYAAAASH